MDDFDQKKAAQVIAARPPFLVATAKLDPSQKNAINVRVDALHHAGFTVGNVAKMGAFVQVRQEERGTAVPDQFAVSIIDVDKTTAGGVSDQTVAFRIKRLDHPGGWGQHLTVQILLFAG
jgi:hypothetical protein